MEDINWRGLLVLQAGVGGLQAVFVSGVRSQRWEVEGVVGIHGKLSQDAFAEFLPAIGTLRTQQEDGGLLEEEFDLDLQVTFSGLEERPCRDALVAVEEKLTILLKAGQWIEDFWW